MAKGFFYSTIKEKSDLLERLKEADDHKDIDIAKRVVEDALLVHELHRIVDLIHEHSLDIRRGRSISAAYESRLIIDKIETLYQKINNKKRRIGR